MEAASPSNLGCTRPMCADDVASSVSLPKADPTSPQRRRDTAHRGGRELRSQWQRAAELLLGEGDIAALSGALELALFMDAKLDAAKMPA
jgi:hypothetical protein